MSNDNELFELCKQVYRVTEWDDRDLKHHLDGEVYDRPLFESDVKADKNSYHPLYTSDYLLERLQIIPTKDPDIQDEPCIIVEHSGVVKPECKWSAKAFNGEWLEVSSITPLKALLKLTLALHEAGELS